MGGAFSREDDFLRSRGLFKIKIEYFLKVMVTSTSRSDPLFDHSGTFYSRGGTFLKTMVELLLISRSGFLRSRIFVSTFHFFDELFIFSELTLSKIKLTAKKSTTPPLTHFFR